jgi:hypothetical protein
MEAGNPSNRHPFQRRTLAIDKRQPRKQKEYEKTERNPQERKHYQTAGTGTSIHESGSPGALL